ncbi:hypothetical protein F441_11384 [Phytophthora nicotianae CJ01A1]|uniref:Uncharacterized protein n=4 Tax=Phytophthora nicotianae TaxID=4792 RepID=V9EXR1_PHYNI|nr:hypothetical protein F443_11462 [Phytophthora nicotianae P1569]ETO72338.1 hypothetical protein F444_11528 [Phytophthora nicotianae P1976]ETP13463.1 hypothetical protein F441_11384 [Phytophthora nicotianae CJ01A1]ETP41561.1 hypothetical protein F442_11352 [Phytophthora nicotianae P10297]
MSIGHFKEPYHYPFKPWPTDGILKKDTTLIVPPLQATLREGGKRGLKPGPPAKHKRKKSKGGD